MTGKAYLNIAREAVDAYGTAPATGWAGLPVEDLGGHEPVVVRQRPNVMVHGQQGPSSKNTRTAIRGASGTVKPYLMSSGLHLLYELVFGTPVITELVPDTVWQRVYTTQEAAPLTSISTQVGREFTAGALDRDTFVGGQCPEMRFAQSLAADSSGVSDEGLAKLEFDINYQTMKPATAQHLPTYVDPELYFAGGDHTLLVGANLGSLAAQCMLEWSLKVPNPLDFAAAACMSSLVRDRAGRGALPAPSIEASWSYKDRTYYDAWINGTALAMRSKWAATAVDLGGGFHPSVQVDIPSFRFSGETPKESATESTKQGLPADVEWNEVDPMLTVTVVSSEAPDAAEES